MSGDPHQQRFRDHVYPPFDEEDDEDRLSTVIMADRMVEGRPETHALRPEPHTVHRRLAWREVEAEGVLLEEEEPTPHTEQRWPGASLSPVTREWEVTEQMPMPSATPPHLRRAVSRRPAPPPPPTLPSIEPARDHLVRSAAPQATPLLDLTPEVSHRSRPGDWSEVSDAPDTLSNQPSWEDDDETSFAPLVAMLALPAFAVFGVAMWLIG